jgi:hypothetical protein
LTFPQDKTPKREAVLERDQLTLEFFDTLESSHFNGLVQWSGKAHERRPQIVGAEARGEKSSKGHKAERGSAGGVG